MISLHLAEMESVNQLAADIKPHCSTAKSDFPEMRNAKPRPGLNFSFKNRHTNIQTLEINLWLSYFVCLLLHSGEKKLSKNWTFLFRQI